MIPPGMQVVGPFPDPPSELIPLLGMLPKDGPSSQPSGPKTCPTLRTALEGTQV